MHLNEEPLKNYQIGKYEKNYGGISIYFPFQYLLKKDNISRLLDFVDLLGTFLKFILDSSVVYNMKYNTRKFGVNPAIINEVVVGQI